MFRIFNLQDGEESKSKVLDHIKNNISFTGANVWILACAIMIASIGLNVNSTAVVIGAMLISPLMGPIVGAGFALGTYDFTLLRRSIKNLLIATTVGLLVSYLYFLITPYKEAQSEILSRTAPNIYDVIIAFLGGLVGVIAVTRVEKGNPIPGVAIATALMPPLCTAGYGLATGKYSFFGGALFLYIINCVFICITTFFIVKLLRYPAKEFVDKKKASAIRNWITIITIIMIIPSGYFAYTFVQEQKFYNKVSNYLKAEFEEKGNTILYRKTFFSSNPKRIELAFLSRKFTKAQIEEENKKLKTYGLENTTLLIRQDSTFLSEAITKRNNEVSNDATKLVSELNNKLEQKKIKVDNLYSESKVLVPELKSISAGKQDIYTDKDTLRNIPIIFYETEKILSNEKKKTFRNWLKVKLKADTLIIYSNSESI